MRGTLFEIRLISSGEYRRVFIRADNLHAAVKAVSEKIPGKIEIISIESRGWNYGDAERDSNQDNRRDSDRNT
jgi:hypothetical protein